MSALAIWVLWVVIGVVCVTIEVFTPSFFIMWFGIGAFAGALVSLFSGSFLFQFLAFIVVSTLLVVFTRPLAKKITGRPARKAAVDGLIGTNGLVIEDVDPETGKGLVRVGSDIWRARSADGISKISVGRRVRVVSVEGTHLIVEEHRREPFHAEKGGE